MMSVSSTAAPSPPAPSPPALPAGLGQAQLTSAYRVMRTIREFEERLHIECASGAIPGAVHLYAGQEAVAAGVCAHLGPDDYVASTHRGHGHAIAKGCDPGKMMLEIYGKADGLCGGKGGSMHLADINAGLLSANGIAGGGVPMACGAALTAKQAGTRQVAVAFLGDGAANQGVFAECLNLAAVWRLPCLFVVEDNGYAQSTAPGFHLGGGDITVRARGFGMPATAVDGYDFFAVYQAAGEAVDRCRAGGGPSVLVCPATRFFAHMEVLDKELYRPPGESEQLRASHDCLSRFADVVTEAGLLTAAELTAIDDQARAAVDAAVSQAVPAPEPGPADLTTDVYVSY
jgi:acetoin:2,6-dichlorophenolindophenol oxidoreductase subunit alpha